jgi:hypothetical protein
MLADSEIARLLLQHGADKNARNKDGETPLMWAALTGTLELVRLLVEAGVPMNVVDARGNTPLHAAAASDNPEVVDYLLSRRVSRDARNRDGRTALDLARQAGHTAVLRSLGERVAAPAAGSAATPGAASVEPSANTVMPAPTGIRKR